MAPSWRWVMKPVTDDAFHAPATTGVAPPSVHISDSINPDHVARPLMDVFVTDASRYRYVGKTAQLSYRHAHDLLGVRVEDANLARLVAHDSPFGL